MKTAFITGATSGIGYEMAKQLSAKGYQLVITGRNQEKLKQVSNEIPNIVKTLTYDLSIGGDVKALINELDFIDLEFDVAINNAGFGLYGEQIELGLSAVQKMLNVNISAVVELTHYFAERMADQGHGHIMNVASTAAYQPQPLMSAYAASKAFVSSFTEGMAIEMKGRGVSLTVLSPGRTKTNFFIQDGKDLSSGGTFSVEKRASPASVASIGLKAMFDKKIREIALFENKFFVFLNRLLPRDWVLKIYTDAMKKI